MAASKNKKRKQDKPENEAIVIVEPPIPCVATIVMHDMDDDEKCLFHLFADGDVAITLTDSVRLKHAQMSVLLAALNTNHMIIERAAQDTRVLH